MKVDFYLLGEKGFIALKYFCEKNEASCVGVVVAARDAAIEKDYFTEIKDLCVALAVEFYERGTEPSSKNSENYAFAIGWRWLINESSKLIVFHDSLLPKYRGFAPLVNMLINGEKDIGVTALIASDEYDKGDVLLQKSVSITYPIKIQSAIDLIAPIYGDLVCSVFQNFLKNDGLIARHPQNEALASYSLWRDEDDYHISWKHSAERIKRFCDALGSPYRGASTYLKGEKIFICEVEVCKDVAVEARADHIGKVIFFDSDCPVVVCGDGLLKIKNYRYDGFDDKKISFRSRFTNKF